MFHADGRFPDGPIALVEVQAYACAALDAMATCSHRRGHAADATRYALRAKTLRDQVDALFWMPEGKFYGIALDGHGDLCRVFASNAGSQYCGPQPPPPSDRPSRVPPSNAAEHTTRLRSMRPRWPPHLRNPA